MEWFNAVDATYRSDLRELNELNFARFDAKLGQRFAEQDAKWEHRIADLRTAMNARFAELETRVTKRLFGFWIAQAATIVGLVFAIERLFH